MASFFGALIQFCSLAKTHWDAIPIDPPKTAIHGGQPKACVGNEQ